MDYSAVDRLGKSETDVQGVHGRDRSDKLVPSASRLVNNLRNASSAYRCRASKCQSTFFARQRGDIRHFEAQWQIGGTCTAPSTSKAGNAQVGRLYWFTKMARGCILYYNCMICLHLIAFSKTVTAFEMIIH